MYSKSERDLLLVSKKLESISGHLKGKSIQIIGASGFVGRWLLESLIFHKERIGLDFQICQVGRKEIYEFSDRTEFLEYDYLRDVTPRMDADFVIFAGTPSQRSTGGEDKILVYNSVRVGLASIVNSIVNSDRKTRFFNCSSGTVLNSQLKKPMNSLELSNFEMKSFQLSEVYKASKILSEELIHQATLSKNFFGINGRLWTFYGNGIPLDAHFAIGNFMLNVLNGEDIVVNGNPRTLRSYLYPIDMSAGIIKSVVYGEDKLVNIGSHLPISIGELAETINNKFGSKKVIYQPNKNIETSYYPKDSDSVKLMSEYDLVDLNTGLEYWFQDLKCGPSSQGK